MAKTYRIRAGAAFCVEGGMALEIRTGGQTIELDDDIAALHADKLEAIEPVQTSALEPLTDQAAAAMSAGLDAIEAGRP